MATFNVTALNLANATASANGADLTNTGSRGAVFVIKITAIAGSDTPSATFTVQGKDPLSGDYYTILATAALTATGTTVLRVYPGLTASANATASDVIPNLFRVICTTGGTVTDLDATVGALLVE